MDGKVSAVLDAYHARMADEHAGRNNRSGGEWHDNQLLAVGPDTGRLLNIIVKSLQAPTILEIGTSFGYSGIWLAEAARASGGRVITMELHPHKSDFAHDMARKAGLADVIDFRVGDAVQMIGDLPRGIDFVLLDLWKDLYVPCLDAFYPKLNTGAIIVADNMVRPGGENVARYAKAVRAKRGLSSVLLPVGAGLEISRFDPA